MMDDVKDVDLSLLTYDVGIEGIPNNKNYKGCYEI